MKEGSYLCTSFHSGYSVEGYVYERDIWLKKGLVLTDDGRALSRKEAEQVFWQLENRGFDDDDEDEGEREAGWK